MQATKEHTSSPRKDSASGQLVMSGINNSGSSQSAFNTTATDQRSANSVEGDKEVEEITSRASKVDLSKRQDNANDNNNLVTLSTRSSEPIPSQPRQPHGILTPSKLNPMDNHPRRQQHSHQSSSKESVAAKSPDAETLSSSSSSTAAAAIAITLDTKIPHPSSTGEPTCGPTKQSQDKSILLLPPPAGAAMTVSGSATGNNSSSCSTSIGGALEEVSYYNQEQAAAASSCSPIDVTKQQLSLNSTATNSCSASTTSSTCNNNNLAGQVPITLAATNKSSARAKPIGGQPGKEQKLSVIVPATSHNFGPFSMGFSANNNNNNQLQQTTIGGPLDVSGRHDYCNGGGDSGDYDTAAVEEEDSINGCNGGGFRHSDENSNSNQFNNNNNIFHQQASSPKAKSAPATPCNVTPLAFHQHNPANNKSNLPNPANTLPVDTRRNISATCRMLPSSISLAQPTVAAAAGATFGGTTVHHPGHTFTGGSGAINDNNGQELATAAAVSDQDLDEMIAKGETLFRQEKFDEAIRHFSQCIELAIRSNHYEYLKKNFRVYSQRAECYFKLNKYKQAMDDSIAARDLNSKWAQTHYILGNAQFQLGKHIDSLTTFSFGLGQVPTNKLLLEALVNAALHASCPKLTSFEENYQKLRERNLANDPFVVVSTIGQELLAKDHHEHAAIVLESALKLGTDNKRFKSSVLSTTSHAFCSIGHFEKGLAYMENEFEIEKSLNDVQGQCRVLSNIGYNYYKMGKFVESLETHRAQTKLAIRNELYQQAAQAFHAIGHIHVSQNKLADALTSHQNCLELLRRLGDNDFDQYKELLAIGHVYALLADYKASEERYKEAMQMLKSSCSALKRDERQVGLIMVYFNLGYLALKRQLFNEAIQHYEQVLNIAREMDPNCPKRLLYELRALGGLGHTCRVFQRFQEARTYFTRQLELAKKVNDVSSQSQALCNLGMTYQHFKDYSTAWRLFDENLQLVEKSSDPILTAYARSYRGSMHFLWGEYTKAQEEYEISLNIFKKLDNCSAERKTIELNLDAVSERLGRSQISLASNTARVKRNVIMRDMIPA